MLSDGGDCPSVGSSRWNYNSIVADSSNVVVGVLVLVGVVGVVVHVGIEVRILEVSIGWLLVVVRFLIVPGG